VYLRETGSREKVRRDSELPSMNITSRLYLHNVASRSAYGVSEYGTEVGLKLQGEVEQ